MMMLFPYQETQQDSVRSDTAVSGHLAGLKSDSSVVINRIPLKDSVPHRLKVSSVIPAFEIIDTTAVCSRNTISDITFYDSNNVVTRIEPRIYDQFPFLFTGKNREIAQIAKASLVKHLRPGSELPFRQLHDDWIILIILVAAFLFSMIRSSSKNMLPDITKFFLFRGSTEPSSREISGLFNWESTIKNLISFLILGLFLYSACSYNDLIPPSFSGILFWLISVFIIIAAVTIRHIICIITGSASGERDVFREYLVRVYLFYRFSAILIFIVIILMSYTTIFPVRSCFIAGIIVMATLYLIRITRLFIIFINKSISLFYLILYLCALEFLPVVICVKYISGVV